MIDIPKDIMTAAADAILAGGRSLRIGDSFHLAIASAILEERLRCAEIALGWAEDEYQAGETRLAPAYIWREIIRGKQHEPIPRWAKSGLHRQRCWL